MEVTFKCQLSATKTRGEFQLEAWAKILVTMAKVTRLTADVAQCRPMERNLSRGNRLSSAAEDHPLKRF